MVTVLLIAFAEGSPIADVKPTQFFPLVLTCFLLLHRHIHLRPLLNIQYWGALSARKKSDIQQNLLFEDPGWERLENLKYRNFWSFQVFSGSSHALAALSIT